MRRKTRWMEGALLLGLAGLLFLFPAESSQAARHGVSLCLDLIIPALFPFFVVSSLLIATGLAGDCAKVFQGPMSRLFGVGGAGTSAFLLGAVGGYPVGAHTLAQLAESRVVTRQEAGRLALFCNNCGPAFLVGAAGVGVFGSREAGFLLLGCNLLAAVLIGVGLHLFLDRDRCPQKVPYAAPAACSLPAALPECVRSAFLSTLGISAYVILFSVLAALADCSGLLPLAVEGLCRVLPGEHAPALVRSLLIGILEISTGTAALAEGASSPAALPLAAFLLGWGGLSVHCQSLPFLTQAGVALRPYLLAKAVQGCLSAGLVWAGAKVVPLSLPVMASAGPLTAPSLAGQELVALWVLAGVYFLVSYKKGVAKRAKRRYNRRK